MSAEPCMILEDSRRRSLNLFGSRETIRAIKRATKVSCFQLYLLFLLISVDVSRGLNCRYKIGSSSGVRRSTGLPFSKRELLETEWNRSARQLSTHARSSSSNVNSLIDSNDLSVECNNNIITGALKRVQHCAAPVIRPLFGHMASIYSPSKPWQRLSSILLKLKRLLAQFRLKASLVVCAFALSTTGTFGRKNFATAASRPITITTSGNRQSTDRKQSGNSLAVSGVGDSVPRKVIVKVELSSDSANFDTRSHHANSKLTMRNAHPEREPVIANAKKVLHSTKLGVRDDSPIVGALNSFASSSSTRTTIGSIGKHSKVRLRLRSVAHLQQSQHPPDVRLVADALQDEIAKDVVQEAKLSWESLGKTLEGVRLDSLIMLIATSAVIPLFKRLNMSPILGFMLAGTLLGPSALNVVRDVHMIDVLGELGIVFFLFEMGLELSLDRLKAMRKDVFGLGTSQFLLTAMAGTGIAGLCGLAPAAAVTVGGSLALSSSAFVLQLLKDKNAMGTRYGKSAFGILLLQDLAVVPLLVVVELLARGGEGLGRALALAGLKATVTLTVMSVVGRVVLDKIFFEVAKSSSQEAFLSIILTTVLFMSFVTKGIGLSDTLGAFLAGILLSETRYRYQIEADIAPFRGLLLGFFFINIGFAIDVRLVAREAPRIAAMLVSLIAGKAAITTALSLTFGTTLASAQQCGLLTAQGGEFAFVAFTIAENMGLLSEKMCKLLLTTVALSMALTPALSSIGSAIASKLERRQGLKHYIGEDTEAMEVASDIKQNDFVFVCGYGRVGKMICDMLDKKFVRYIALDSSPINAMDARSKGLPVFYGDITRSEVLKNFDVGSAQACVVTMDDMTATNKAVIKLRKLFPKLPLIVLAKNPQHQQRLQSMFDEVYAVAPVLSEDSVLLTLPFGGAVLQAIGVSRPEIEAILEDSRKQYMESEVYSQTIGMGSDDDDDEDSGGGDDDKDDDREGGGGGGGEGSGGLGRRRKMNAYPYFDIFRNRRSPRAVASAAIDQNKRNAAEMEAISMVASSVSSSSSNYNYNNRSQAVDVPSSIVSAASSSASSASSPSSRNINAEHAEQRAARAHKDSIQDEISCSSGSSSGSSTVASVAGASSDPLGDLRDMLQNAAASAPMRQSSMPLSVPIAVPFSKPVEVEVGPDLRDELIYASALPAGTSQHVDQLVESISSRKKQKNTERGGGKEDVGSSGTSDTSSSSSSSSSSAPTSQELKLTTVRASSSAVADAELEQIPSSLPSGNVRVGEDLDIAEKLAAAESAERQRERQRGKEKDKDKNAARAEEERVRLSVVAIAPKLLDSAEPAVGVDVQHTVAGVATATGSRDSSSSE